MQFNDDITLDIANTVRNVMEGKPAPVKFNVVDEDGKVVKGFASKEAANKYVVDNRDKQVLNIVVAEVDQPKEPTGQIGSKMGEVGFKKSHKVKKSGEDDRGHVTKEEVQISLDESVITERLKKKPGRGKTTADIDFIGDNKLRADAKRKYKVNIKPTGSGGTAYFIYCQKDDSNLKMRVLQNGNLQNANNSYGSTSDVKLKENIVDANSQWDDIKSLRVRNFNFKDDPDKVKMLGVVAQEAEAVSAGLVETDNDIEIDETTGEGKIVGTTKFVKYSILYMKAVKCLQEAQTRIEKLEQENIALRARVTNLEDN